MSRALKFVNVLSLEQFRLYCAKPSTANVWKVAYLSPIFRAAGIIIPRLQSKCIV